MIKYHYEGLYQIVSGAQTGADQAGLYVAKEFGLITGGWIPKGFRTVLGSMPYLGEEFGVQEHPSPDYPPRTKLNAAIGDMTVRLATNFNSAGEQLTLKYIRSLKKTHYDVLLDGQNYELKAAGLAQMISNNSVSTLNVAGNGDRDTQFGFHFTEASTILRMAFQILDAEGLLKRR